MLPTYIPMDYFILFSFLLILLFYIDFVVNAINCYNNFVYLFINWDSNCISIKTIFPIVFVKFLPLKVTFSTFEASSTSTNIVSPANASSIVPGNVLSGSSGSSSDLLS